MGEGEIDDTGIAMEVEGVWNLGGTGMLSCIRAGLLPLPPLFCSSIGHLNVSDRIHL